MSTHINLSKLQLSKMIQSGGIPGALLGKLARPLIILLAKNVPAPLATMASVSAIDGAIKKKNKKKLE